MITGSQALPGRLLRLERLRQGKGQKEVCYGICVTSWLSKIEHGQVYPDPELLAALYERLGIPYEGRSEGQEQLREKIDLYYERLLYMLDTELPYRELHEQEKRLRYSELAVDWLLIQGMENVFLRNAEGKTETADAASICEQLSVLQDCMDNRQRGCYSMLLSIQEKDKELAVQYGRQASELWRNSLTLNNLCDLYLNQGNYSAVHQIEQSLTAAVLEEGNTYQLANYYFIKGSAYSCLDMDDMMMTCYRKSIHLLQNTGWEGDLAALYYNIGASCVKQGRYEEAMEYLEKVSKPEESVMTLHKKALACIRGGRIPEGREFLQRMKEKLDKSTPASSLRADYLRYEEACRECGEGFLDDPKYLELLEELAEELEREYHFGHLYFYKDMIVEACRRQRKYKKALEFEQKISETVVKNQC